MHQQNESLRSKGRVGEALIGGLLKDWKDWDAGQER